MSAHDEEDLVFVQHIRQRTFRGVLRQASISARPAGIAGCQRAVQRRRSVPGSGYPEMEIAF